MEANVLAPIGSNPRYASAMDTIGAEERAALRLARGVCRLLADLGYGTLTEFPLACGRRADVIGIDGAGSTAIVEIKSSPADFLADGKWTDYLDWCDLFYFAVPSGFPQALLPPEQGLIVADGYGGEILRPAPVAMLHASRRRTQLLRFALTASARLQRLIDPPI